MGALPPIQAANIGMADSLLLMLLALVVFGPRRLPQIGRQVGKLMGELRKASNDFKFQLEDELRKADDFDRQKEEEARKRAQEAQAAQAATLAAPAPLGAQATATPDPYAELNASASAETVPFGEATLKVQPPSTGEIVGAERPGSPAAETVASVETQSVETEPAAAVEAAADGSKESHTEQAAEPHAATADHNG